MRPSIKKRNGELGAKPATGKSYLDTFRSENITVASRHEIKYALVCFTVNLEMAGCKALSAHKNLTLKLLRDCEAHLAKLDNAKKDHKCDKKCISRYLSCRILHICSS